MDADHDDQQRRRFPLPASSLINFGALVSLFGAIFLLQHYAGNTSSASSLLTPNRVATAPAAAPTVGPAAIEAPATAPAAAPTAVAAETPAPQMTVAAVAPPVPSAPADPADEEPEPAELPAPQPTSVQPQVAQASAAAESLAVVRPTPKVRRAPALPQLRVDEDRRFNIAELDNEAARQRYLAANRVGATADAAPSGKPTP